MIGRVLVGLGLVCAGGWMAASPSGLNPTVPAGALAHSEAPDAADFCLTDLDGDKIRLSDFRGRIVALHFFARWCASCKLDLKSFQAVSEKYSEEDVVVVGLAYASGDRESLRRYTESLGVTFPVLMADEDVLEAYNVATFPSNAIVDREGRIRVVSRRLMDARYWDRVLDGLLAER